jgi:putative transposase
LEEADYLYALHLIKKVSREFHLDIFSFVLMPNHLHLLLRIIEENLPEAMKSLFESYAMFFNYKYARKGHVFCGNYRCALCLEDRYLLTASLYIHLNPVKANLVKNPLDYRWSSCAVFVNPSLQQSFLKRDFILRILNNNVTIACQMYQKLLLKAEKLEMENLLEKPSALADFLLKLQGAYVDLGILSTGGNLQNELRTLNEKGKLRTASDLKARAFLAEQLKARGFSISEISRMMKISRLSLYKTLKLTKDVEPKVLT